MATFEDAIDTVLEHEGGFAHHPDDPGGATNYGISLRWLRQEGLLLDLDGDGDMDVEDIRRMTRADAIKLYREKWWDRYEYGRINSQAVATKVFDLAVNQGNKQAVKHLQRALGACGFPVTVDGILGPKTLSAVNHTPATRVIPALRSEAAGFFRMLVERNAALRSHGIPAPDFSKFEAGWLRRAYA